MRRQIIVLTLVAASLVLATSSLAGGGKAGSSITLVMSDSSDFSASAITAPTYGDHVTFDLVTTADRPYVTVNCHQGTNWVYAAQAGFWADYPGGQDFNLAASSWPGGAADCTATLGVLNADGTKFRALATTTFHVDA